MRHSDLSYGKLKLIASLHHIICGRLQDIQGDVWQEATCAQRKSSNFQGENFFLCLFDAMVDGTLISRFIKGRGVVKKSNSHRHPQRFGG